MNDVLFDARAATMLTHQNALGVLRCMIEQSRVGEIVVDHDVGALQAIAAAQREQPWISRTGADQVDFAAQGDVSARRTSAMIPAPPCPSRRSAKLVPSVAASSTSPLIVPRMIGAPLGS